MKSCKLCEPLVFGVFGDIVKYEWSLPGEGGALSQQTGTSTVFSLSSGYSGTLPADFRVILEVTDRSGNTDCDSVTICVDIQPGAEVESSGTIEKDGCMIVDGTNSKGRDITYKWSTSEGTIIGSANEPTVKFFGSGMYRLTVTDIHGCQSINDFHFPIEVYSISANPDNYRITWTQDTVMNVLENDISSVPFNDVQVIKPPTQGVAKVNADNSITYIPGIRQPGHDEFEYMVCNIGSVCDSTKVSIDIYDSYLFIPEGFSPNGDGVNDVLEFKGLEKFKGSRLIIYTRSGQPVYENTDDKIIWDGRIRKGTLKNPELAATGTYYYILKLGQTNKVIKGFIYIGY